LDTGDKRLAELEADIRKRLADVCSEMPDIEFNGLVRSIAKNSWRAEQRANQSWLEAHPGTGTPRGGHE
jgi:hypothetical protein